MTDLFLTDVIAYYARMGTQPISFQVHSVKVGGTAPGPSVALQGLAKQCRASGVWGLSADPSLDPHYPSPSLPAPRPGAPGAQLSWRQ